MAHYLSKPPSGNGLTLLFCLDRDEDVKALHQWRIAFGPMTDIEAVSADVFALHVRPGASWCTQKDDESEVV